MSRWDGQRDNSSPQLDFTALEVPPDHHIGPELEATIAEAFARFHDENPHVYVQLVTMARQAKAAGSVKLGIGMLFEVLRWRHTLKTGGDEFKLNNNYRSYYARLIMAEERDLYGIFEVRRLHGPLPDEEIIV